jgi:serine/threonine protein phosphatase PrpC
VSEREIAQLLGGGADVEGAADGLVEAALGHGGADNVSVVIVRIDAAPLSQGQLP